MSGSSSTPGALTTGKLNYERAKSMVEKATSRFPNVQTISAKEVLALREEGKRVVLVDVRTEAEREVSMLEGAVTMEAFEANNYSNYQRESLAEPDAVVVPYCTVGYRSGQYGKKLQDMGYTSVRNLEGVLLWTHDVGQGLVAVDSSRIDQAGGGTNSTKEVKRVHVYASPWDAASSDYETVTFTAGSWLRTKARSVGSSVGSMWSRLSRGKSHKDGNLPTGASTDAVGT